ncbi:Rrf2 family iron-sulfur cluster assembly transcriptional regulator [Breznakia sp. PF5-3]|uniref:RrF2 family transcriptional regulator n=1 Tax=unclassified Breznakia TaxID=2623764 RepID=UPI0024063918|nr:MULTISPECIES: Rrf2 family transcriptional regulator [unclassified Breznakia]MDL2276846.1 Rrf2 family transcriptional regulator [Breznakia sp. OttesenSCG-928-G09]MDF9823944.1 Rrf2 family iron-sulfur cluster assembly transcriptional regulator [Breznakia sp. PM6-1]MDF9834743.1 Rrf2 family iron-sulfur cluster assembly transcriptional regulator [Breznakia sp. PF5-3]MDF9836821.1 Rrf2 family iron-sulfur cluster assembly transcriptional regulator [Breznakia sp. PFB2-8]MDF9858839.1 Rrf2 family iron-
MKLTTKSRYAVRCCLGLAIFGDEDLISVRSASRHLKLSTKYIENIFLSLKKHHFIESVRGIKGGYRLAKKPEDIDVYSIIVAMENSHTVAPYHKRPDLLARVLRRDLWYRIDQELQEYLTNITIADIIEMNGGMEEIKKLDWYKEFKEFT